MKNKGLKANQFAAASMLLVFLFTSCPSPVTDNTVKEPVKQELKYVALDENGQPTDSKDTTSKLYWVEADGVIQPGRISITHKEVGVTVVNFIDTETNNTFRMFFMDHAKLPYRIIMECKDELGQDVKLIGSDLCYNEESQKLSIKFTDANDRSQTSVLSDICLNKSLFKTSYYQRNQYLITVTSCLLYAMGESDTTWSEDTDFSTTDSISSARWSIRGFFKKALRVVAVVAFVVAVVVAPAAVIATATSLAITVTTTNVVPLVVSAAAAVASLLIPEGEENKYTETDAAYEGGIEPPIINIWQVDSQGNPVENPGQDNWFPNDGVIHMHNGDEANSVYYFCIQQVGGELLETVEYGQSSMSYGNQTVDFFTNFETKESILKANSNSFTMPEDGLFYCSVTESLDISYSEYKLIYFYIILDNKIASSEATYINNIQHQEMAFANKDNQHILDESSTYKNVFKVNICTDEYRCPQLTDSSMEEI